MHLTSLHDFCRQNSGSSNSIMLSHVVSRGMTFLSLLQLCAFRALHDMVYLWASQNSEPLVTRAVCLIRPSRLPRTSHRCNCNDIYSDLLSVLHHCCRCRCRRIPRQSQLVSHSWLVSGPKRHESWMVNDERRALQAEARREGS